MKPFLPLAFAIFSLLLLSNAYAYYNITYTNTTVLFNGNQSAHVVEQFTLFVSNSSYSQYLSNRNAVGLSLNYWQNILYTNQLVEHIVNSGHSISQFEFLPGPLATGPTGGVATLTINYYINNVTLVTNTAPRRFEYTFNDSLFNFENTANGQALPNAVRLNFIIPHGATAVAIYPLPDSPQLNFISNSTNVTSFSWYSGEPLSGFTFQYITTQSLQAEVLQYLQNVYSSYTAELYLTLIVAIVLIGVYSYLKIVRQEK